MVKQTTELGVAIAATLDSLFQALADEKLRGDDFQFFMDDIFKWITGIENLTYAQDLASSTEPEVETMFTSVRREMPNVPTETAYDITSLMKGLYCMNRLVARKSFEAGRAAAIAELQNLKQ